MVSLVSSSIRWVTTTYGRLSCGNTMSHNNIRAIVMWQYDESQQHTGDCHVAIRWVTKAYGRLSCGKFLPVFSWAVVVSWLIPLLTIDNAIVNPMRGTERWSTEAPNNGLQRHRTMVYRGTERWSIEAPNDGLQRHRTMVYRGTERWSTEASKVPGGLSNTWMLDTSRLASKFYKYCLDRERTHMEFTWMCLDVLPMRSWSPPELSRASFQPIAGDWVVLGHLDGRAAAKQKRSGFSFLYEVIAVRIELLG